MNEKLIQKDHLLADYSSWKVGGLADFFSAPSSLEELKEVLLWARKEEQPVTIFSGATNVLISDEGVRGLTIGMSCLNGTSVEVSDDRVELISWAGSSKGELVKIFLKYQLDPALFVAGLPGDVGGGVVMNAGVSKAHSNPREFCEIVDWVEVLRWSDEAGDFVIVRLEKDQLKWTYRHCEGWQPGVITRVGMSWKNSPNQNVKNRVRENMKWRLQRQPLDLPNCGSVFRNPDEYSSGALIEKVGLKGFTVGGAKVSEKHANFIVNFDRAQSSDIDAIIKHVQKTVSDQEGILLKTEVIYLGQW